PGLEGEVSARGACLDHPRPCYIDDLSDVPCKLRAQGTLVHVLHIDDIDAGVEDGCRFLVRCRADQNLHGLSAPSGRCVFSAATGVADAWLTNRDRSTFPTGDLGSDVRM